MAVSSTCNGLADKFCCFIVTINWIVANDFGFAQFQKFENETDKKWNMDA